MGGGDPTRNIFFPLSQSFELDSHHQVLDRKWISPNMGYLPKSGERKKKWQGSSMIEKTGIQSEIILRFTHQQAAERTHIGERNKQEVWAFIPMVMEGILLWVSTFSSRVCWNPPRFRQKYSILWEKSPTAVKPGCGNEAKVWCQEMIE